MKARELAQKYRVSESLLSKLENGKPFDPIERYMSIYGIKTEKAFMRLHKNGSLSKVELELQRPMSESFPLLAQEAMHTGTLTGRISRVIGDMMNQQRAQA